MTPKEKAEEIVLKIASAILPNKNKMSKKQHDKIIWVALRLVDEVISENHKMDEYNVLSTQMLVSRFEFWSCVKKEVEML